MTHVRLPPFPVVSDQVQELLSKEWTLTFSSGDGPPPGNFEFSPCRFIFGRGTDWTADRNQLRIECSLSSPRALAKLFGPSGVACASSSILLCLEWTSVKMARRGLSSPIRFNSSQLNTNKPVSLGLSFAAKELFGDLQFSVQLFIDAPGTPRGDERHLANHAGSRLGSLSNTWELIIDGSASLFPIVEVERQVSDPLWGFFADWDDVTFDEFTSDYVALEINKSHPAFKDLYGDASAPYSTSLFRQVVASWLLLFFDTLRERTKDEPIEPTETICQWDSIQDGYRAELLLPGSIGRAAREFCARGDLDFTSSTTLLATAQQWIDRRFGSV